DAVASCGGFLTVGSARHAPALDVNVIGPGVSLAVIDDVLVTSGAVARVREAGAPPCGDCDGAGMRVQRMPHGRIEESVVRHRSVIVGLCRTSARTERP